VFSEADEPPVETRVVSGVIDCVSVLEHGVDNKPAQVNPCMHFDFHDATDSVDPHAWFSKSYVQATMHQSSLYEETTASAYINSGLQNKPRLLFVSHDASRTGAPAIILQLLEIFSQSDAFECFTILDQGGERLSEFEALSHIHVMSHSRYNRTFTDQEAANEIASMFEFNGLFSGNAPVCAIVNSAESVRVARNLANVNVPIISLIHEIAAYYPPKIFSEIGRISEKVVFPSEFVKRAATCFSDLDSSKVHVRGQGLLTQGFGSAERDSCRRALREQLGIEEDSVVILNVGTMDLRKGGDLFVDTAKLCLQQLPEGASVYFVWFGKPDENLTYPQDVVQQNGLEEHVRFMPATSEIEQVFMGGDMFLLTARADPFPCVVHEAMASGLPVIAFENGGGAPELIGDDCGQIVGMLNLKDMTASVLTYIRDKALRETHGKNAMERISKHWDFLSYQRDLYELMKCSIAAPESAWPTLTESWAPTKLIIMSGTQAELNALKNQREAFGSDWHVALISGRFEPDANATAMALRGMGHHVRHFQPKENSECERASIVAVLLKKTGVREVVLVNAFQYVASSQIDILSCTLHVVQTEERADDERRHILSPSQSSNTCVDDKLMELPR